MQPDQPNLTIRRLLDLLRRRGPIVLLCVVVAVAVSAAYSLRAQKKYTATAALLFNNTPVSQQIAGLQAVPNTNPQSQQDTNTQLLKLGDLAQRTATNLHSGMTGQSVADSISITPTGDTTVVNVSSTLPSPTLAAKVANSYAKIFVKEQQNGNRQYYAAALATVESQIASLSPAEARGAQGLALQNRAQSLATLAQVRGDTVSLVQPATVPTSPSSPKTKRNVAIAALLGIALGIAIVLAVERLDQNIRDPEELERLYGLPLLGAVPQTSALRRGGRARENSPPNSIIDTFQFVRARLRYFNVDRDLRTVAVVSAQPGDGKTTTAHWLAHATGAVGSRTLLIEGDLRRSTMAQEIGLDSGPGLADVLIGARTFEEAIQTTRLDDAEESSGSVHSVDVMVGGALPPNPAEMLESQAMAEVIAHARSRYDFVVIDTAPLGVISDALPLLGRVDGVIIVASLRRHKRDAARRLKATLDSVEAPSLGVIANRVKVRDGSGYGYGYKYEYTSTSGKQTQIEANEVAGFVPTDSIRVEASTGSSAGSRPDKAKSAEDLGGDQTQGEGPIGRADLLYGEDRAPGDDAPVASASPLRRRNGNGTVQHPHTEGGDPPAGRVLLACDGRSESVLIYRMGGIPATVAAIPCFHLIERAYPGAERVAITDLGSDGSGAMVDSLLRPAGLIDRSIVIENTAMGPRRLRQLAKELRGQSAQTLIYLPSGQGLSPTLRDLAVFRMAGIAQILGAAPSTENQTSTPTAGGDSQPEASRLAHTLSGLGHVDLDDRAWWDLRIKESERAAARKQLKELGGRRFVAIDLSPAPHDLDWSTPNWLALLTELRARLDKWGLVLLGDSADQASLAAVADVWPEDVVSLCGSVRARQAAAVISLAGLVVGRGGGLFELAGAVGTPGVGIYDSKANPAAWHAPWPHTRVARAAGRSRDVLVTETLRQVSTLDVLRGRAHAAPLN